MKDNLLRKIRKGMQIPLFPLENVALNISQVATNLAVFDELNLNDSFFVELRDPDKFYVNGYALPRIEMWVFKFLSSASASKIVPACSECGHGPVIFFMQCSCGVYIWCRRHFSREIFWDHYSYYFSAEQCYKLRHPSSLSYDMRSSIRRPVNDIERLLSAPEISVEAAGANRLLVKVRRRNESEINSHRRWLSSYSTSSLVKDDGAGV